MRSFFALLTLLLFATSCSKNDGLAEPQSYTYTDEEYYQGLDPIFIELGSRMGMFFDELIKDGTDTFFARNQELTKKLEGPLTLEEVKSLYVEVHKMDQEIVEDYFDVLVNHSALILNRDYKKPMMDGIFFYAFKTKKGLELRWLFTTIANVLGSSCQVKVVAGVFDTAVLGAIAVATAPTGLGAVAAGVSVTSSYVNTVNTALNCK